MKYRMTALAMTALLAACGGGGSDSGSAGTSPPSSATTTTTLAGRLYAPDGVTPISNALVYVEGSTPVAIDRSTVAAAATVACGTVPDSTWAYACTGADGSYTLKAAMPSLGAKLVAIKGAFKAEATVVPQGSQTSVSAISIGTTGATATKMAVVTGYFDSVEDILAKLGFGSADASGRLVKGTEKFDLYDGNDSLDTSYKEVEALLADADGNGKADIFNYAIVFFNCGLGSFESNAGAIAVLREYVNAGGRIYVSDQAYDLVEQAFPAYIDYLGSDATAPSAAETRDAAEEGSDGLAVSATVDTQLGAWLQSVGCVNGNCLTGGKATIDGFLSSWAVMNGAHAAPPSPVKVWVLGPVTYTGQTTPVDKPLTVSFNQGSGRVTYTSYHNENEFSTAGGFVAAERILQFLVFEL